MPVAVELAQQTGYTGKSDIHVWSVGGTAEYHYFATQHWGGYVLGRYALYHRTAEVSRFGGCPDCEPSAMVKLDGESKPGLDLGAGFAFRIADASNVKIFTEARYVWTGAYANSFAVLGASAQQRQTFIPLRAGVRW